MEDPFCEARFWRCCSIKWGCIINCCWRLKKRIYWDGEENRKRTHTYKLFICWLNKEGNRFLPPSLWAMNGWRRGDDTPFSLSEQIINQMRRMEDITMITIDQTMYRTHGCTVLRREWIENGEWMGGESVSLSILICPSPLFLSPKWEKALTSSINSLFSLTLDYGRFIEGDERY